MEEKNMKIKILKSCAGDRFSYYEGDVVDANSEIAKELIKSKYAKAITGSAKAETK